ncbi:MAG TPA: 4-aminobutyrate--2-oxoglutarate transaminase [Candidatus Polarisedimenticolia bacterium]|nr:4-aminobutyrate--2-oxoglutarate transaminase [Candidatus Polarisedimenticolia bacterium]
MTKHIALKTAIPGPNSQALMRARQAAVPRGPYNITPLFIARGEGAMLEDVDGNRFIDFAGGIGVLNTGHAPKNVVKAIQQQAERYLHSCFHVTMNEPYVRLAETMNRITPGSFPKKTFFANSGAEGVENAIKVARNFTRREAVICFEDAFHGRTLLAMSLTSKVHPYKDHFGPYAPEIHRMPFSYCYRCPWGKRYPGCNIECATFLDDFFKRYVDPTSVAALIVEPVLGEGGFIMPPQEYYPNLVNICRKHGVLVIADEVQTGFGRTGKMWACEHWGIEPDILIASKSIAAGLPLASVTGRAEIMDAPMEGSLGGTFGGNPVACAAALAAIETIEKQNLPERAAKIGEKVRDRFEALWKRCSLVGNVRGVGAMRAIEFVKDRATKEPAKDLVNRIVRLCYERGLIVIGAGTYGNVIRTLMPLVITEEQLEEGLDVLEGAIMEAAQSLQPAPVETKAPSRVAPRPGGEGVTGLV